MLNSVFSALCSSRLTDVVHVVEKVDKCLVGNKCDLADRREVSKAEGDALAAKYGILHFETSAKDNLNVDDAFLSVAQSVMSRDAVVASPTGVTLKEKVPDKAGCSC
jgi:GTPase SAR1 family protein